MKVVVAIDSFKGCITSEEAGKAVKKGVLKVSPDADVVVKTLADGGEGTVEALNKYMKGKQISVEVTGPMGEKTIAHYSLVEQTKTAIVEVSTACGITLLKGKKEPMKATSYGVGELILDAISKGARNFVIGIGGTATNDCGIGMLSALGFGFVDKWGKKVGIDANALQYVDSIDTSNVHENLKDCTFKVACDVSNGLCGENGATYIFGTQKGVSDKLKPELDAIIKEFAKVTEDCFGVDYANSYGAGAGGGLGFAFHGFLHADLCPGIELILDTIDLKQELQDADVVFTGEGRLDAQTAMGKVPVGVANLAKKFGATVVALAGTVKSDAGVCNDNGIDAFFPILRKVSTLDEAMDANTTKKNLQNTAEQVMRLILTRK